MNPADPPAPLLHRKRGGSCRKVTATGQFRQKSDRVGAPAPGSPDRSQWRF